ncbi:MAG: hypothetical protein JNM06_12090 [Blastocatellia bacterium]|nr:hypothetical protein [Blastocatellia bacterium]
MNNAILNNSNSNNPNINSTTILTPNKKHYIKKDTSEMAQILVLSAPILKITEDMMMTLIALYAYSNGRSTFHLSYINLYPYLVPNPESEITEDGKVKHSYRKIKELEDYQQTTGIIFFHRTVPKFNPNDKNASEYDITPLENYLFTILEQARLDPKYKKESAITVKDHIEIIATKKAKESKPLPPKCITKQKSRKPLTIEEKITKEIEAISKLLIEYNKLAPTKLAFQIYELPKESPSLNQHHLECENVQPNNLLHNTEGGHGIRLDILTSASQAQELDKEVEDTENFEIFESEVETIELILGDRVDTGVHPEEKETIDNNDVIDVTVVENLKSVDYQTFHFVSEIELAANMLALFASVGCQTVDFNLVEYDPNNPRGTGKSVESKKCLSIDEFYDNIPRAIKLCYTVMLHFFMRPRSSKEDIQILQLDDLKNIEQFKQHAFLGLETSSDNYQAALAIECNETELKSIKNQFIELYGVDKGANGSYRVAGSPNLKPKYAPDFPFPNIVFGNYAKILTIEDLEVFGIKVDNSLLSNSNSTSISDNENQTNSPLCYGFSARFGKSNSYRREPDYQYFVERAKYKQDGSIDLSGVDYCFCGCCLKRGFSQYETVIMLQRYREKARLRPDYAWHTVKAAAKALGL